MNQIPINDHPDKIKYYKYGLKCPKYLFLLPFHSFHLEINAIIPLDSLVLVPNLYIFIILEFYLNIIELYVYV